MNLTTRILTINLILCARLPKTESSASSKRDGFSSKENPSSPLHGQALHLCFCLTGKSVIKVVTCQLLFVEQLDQKVYLVTILGHMFKDVWKNRFDSSLLSSTFILIFSFFFLYITATPYYSSCVLLVRLFEKITTIKWSSELFPHQWHDLASSRFHRGPDSVKTSQQ